MEEHPYTQMLIAQSQIKQLVKRISELYKLDFGDLETPRAADNIIAFLAKARASRLVIIEDGKVTYPENL